MEDIYRKESQAEGGGDWERKEAFGVESEAIELACIDLAQLGSNVLICTVNRYAMHLSQTRCSKTYKYFSLVS